MTGVQTCALPISVGEIAEHDVGALLLVLDELAQLGILVSQTLLGRHEHAALVAGAVSAAAMSPPLDFAASDAGYVKLIDFGQFVKAYGFLALTARKDWLAKNRPVAEALLRATSKAVDWLYDPANKAEAVALLMQETKQSKEISEKTYDYVVADLQAFSRKLDVPDADFNNVLKLFQELGVVKSREATKAKYVDLSFLNK